MSHPVNDLDDLVHQRVRLGILAMTTEASEVDFGYLRGTLQLTDGNLSRHLQALQDAGIDAIRKGYAGKRPRTWVRITPVGRSALDAELAALKALIRHVDRAHVPRADEQARSDGLPGTAS